MPLAPTGRGKVWLVGAGPGDPDLITCRGLEVLEQAEVVLHDALSHPELLQVARNAEVHNVGKRYGERSPAQTYITEQLLYHAKRGKRVVRLKGGDPLLFARGAEEALALEQAGVPFEIVPGISSPVAAAEFSGIPLTHRDLSSSVTFITGSDQEGHEWSKAAWTKLASVGGTICVLMGMRRLEEITAALVEGGRAKETPVAVVQWAARPEQRVEVGVLDDIANRVRARGLSNPAIIIVGEVVALREQMAWFDRKPLFGQRILVPRAVEQSTDTVQAIRRRSAEAIACAAIEIVPAGLGSPLEQAVRNTSSYDWVVFTSQNGVRAFFGVVDQLALDARVFGAARIAAIGPKTAAALEQRGLRADLVAPEFIAESLAEKLLQQSPVRVLLPRAAEAREILPDLLRNSGVSVDVVAAYETRPVAGHAEECLRLAVERATALLLTSGSIVRSLFDAVGAGATEAFSSRTVVAIGPITKRVAQSLGIRVDVCASEYTVEGALDALEEHLIRAHD